MTEIEIATTLENHKMRIEQLESRMEKAETVLTKIDNLTHSMNALTESINGMVEEQKNINDRLSDIEKEPLENYKFIKKQIATALISCVVGALVTIIINLL